MESSVDRKQRNDARTFAEIYRGLVSCLCVLRARRTARKSIKRRIRAGRRGGEERRGEEERERHIIPGAAGFGGMTRGSSVQWNAMTERGV
jgi:hypothetical protein